jgi:hypothetical protein
MKSLLVRARFPGELAHINIRVFLTKKENVVVKLNDTKANEKFKVKLRKPQTEWKCKTPFCSFRLRLLKNDKHNNNASLRLYPLQY